MGVFPARGGGDIAPLSSVAGALNARGHGWRGGQGLAGPGRARTLFCRKRGAFESGELGTGRDQIRRLEKGVMVLGEWLGGQWEQPAQPRVTPSVSDRLVSSLRSTFSSCRFSTRMGHS